MSDDPARAVTPLLERAADAHRRGDIAGAEQICRRILTAYPEEPEAIHLMGVISHQRGKNPTALRLIDHAIALGSRGAEIHTNRGTVLCALSRYRDALESFDHALSIGPATAELLSNRGLALYELRRPREAESSFREALALNPAFAQAHAGLASVLCENGRYVEAVASEERGLSLRADWNNRMDYLTACGRFADAVDLLDQAMPSGVRPVTKQRLTPRPIRRIVVDRGHHLMHPVEAADISEVLGLPVQVVDLATTAPADYGAAADTLVIYSHGIRMARSGTMRAIKQAAPDCPVVAWGFANHIGLPANAMLAATADIYFPSHVTPADYLTRWSKGPLGPVIPLALFQWPRATLRALYRDCRDESRSDQLSGHFSLYPSAFHRNRLVAEAIEGWPEADLSLRRGWEYHDLPARDRFLIWRRRKTSVVLPVGGDLSMRFFDALASGQVPIVPRDILDFDRVIPPEDQARLPVIRLERYDLESLRAAHAAAIAAFDRGGEAAAAERHRFVREKHMVAHRLRDIAIYAGIDGTAPSWPEIGR